LPLVWWQQRTIFEVAAPEIRKEQRKEL